MGTRIRATWIMKNRGGCLCTSPLQIALTGLASFEFCVRLSRVLGEYPLIHLLCSVFFGDAITLLYPAHQLVALALDDIDIVIGQSAPPFPD